MNKLVDNFLKRTMIVWLPFYALVVLARQVLEQRRSS